MRLTAPAIARLVCALRKTFAGHVNRDERGRTCSVDRNAGAAQVQQVGNAVGGDAVRVARSQIGVDCLKVILVVEDYIGVIESADSDEDARSAARQLVRRLPRILESLPGHFEQQTLLRIHGRGFARRDAEEMRIELIDAGKESAPARAHLGGGPGQGIVQRVDIPAIARNFRDGIHAVSQQSPKFLEARRAREPATDADDGDGLGAADFRMASRAMCVIAIPVRVAVAVGVAGQAM